MMNINNGDPNGKAENPPESKKVSHDASMLLSLVKEQQSAERELAETVANDWKKLSELPSHHLTRSVCLAAVRANGFALEFVPYGMRDAELCFAAFDSPCEVPEEKRMKRAALDSCHASGERHDRDCLDEDLKRSGGRFVASEELRELRRKAEKHGGIYAAAWESDGCDSPLAYVPEGVRCKEICLAAVRVFGASSLKYVPAAMFDQEFADAAFCEDRNAYEAIEAGLRAFGALEEDRERGWTWENVPGLATNSKDSER